MPKVSVSNFGPPHNSVQFVGVDNQPSSHTMMVK